MKNTRINELGEFSKYLLILLFIHLQSKQKVFMLRNKPTRHAGRNLVKMSQPVYNLFPQT